MAQNCTHQARDADIEHSWRHGELAHVRLREGLV